MDVIDFNEPFLDEILLDDSKDNEGWYYYSEVLEQALFTTTSKTFYLFNSIHKSTVLIFREKKSVFSSSQSSFNQPDYLKFLWHHDYVQVTRSLAIFKDGRLNLGSVNSKYTV